MATGNPVTVTTAWTLVYSSNASGDFNGAIESVSGGQITCRIATSLPSASDGGFIVDGQPIDVSLLSANSDKLYARSQLGSGAVVLSFTLPTRTTSVQLPASLGAKSIAASLSTTPAIGTATIADNVSGHVSIVRVSVAAVAAQYSKIQFENPVGSGKTLVFFGLTVWGSSGTNVYSITEISTITGSVVANAARCTLLGGTASPIKVYTLNEVTAPAAATLGSTSTNVTNPPGANPIASNSFLVLPEGKMIQVDCNTVNIGMNINAAVSSI